MKILVICMNSEMIIGLFIISFVAGIMIIIGLCQMNKKDEPVGFYNVIDPPKDGILKCIDRYSPDRGYQQLIKFVPVAEPADTPYLSYVAASAELLADKAAVV